MRLKDVLLYEYSNKSLGVILKLCPFSRIIALISSITVWPQVLGPFNSTRYRFHLMEGGLRFQQKVVDSITSVPLLYQ